MVVVAIALVRGKMSSRDGRSLSSPWSSPPLTSVESTVFSRESSLTTEVVTVSWLDDAEQSLDSIALTTFCFREAVFGRPGLLSKGAVASTRELHNFHAITNVLSLRSTEPRGLLEGYSSARPMREAVRRSEERRTGRAKDFAACRWSSCWRGLIADECSHRVAE